MKVGEESKKQDPKAGEEIARKNLVEFVQKYANKQIISLSTNELHERIRSLEYENSKMSPKCMFSAQRALIKHLESKLHKIESENQTMTTHWKKQMEQKNEKIQTLQKQNDEQRKALNLSRNCVRDLKEDLDKSNKVIQEKNKKIVLHKLQTVYLQNQIKNLKDVVIKQHEEKQALSGSVDSMESDEKMMRDDRVSEEYKEAYKYICGRMKLKQVMKYDKSYAKWIEESVMNKDGDSPDIYMREVVLWRSYYVKEINLKVMILHNLRMQTENIESQMEAVYSCHFAFKDEVLMKFVDDYIKSIAVSKVRLIQCRGQMEEAMKRMRELAEKITI